MPMQPTDEEGVDDMATLTELHGGAIMHNLYQRYKRNQIYVSSALSPLKILPVFSFLLLRHMAYSICFWARDQIHAPCSESTAS